MPRLVIVALVVGLVTAACAKHVVVLVVPGLALDHDVSLWGNDDRICVAPPTSPPANVYVQRRCVDMRTLRALINGTLRADP